MLRSLADPCVYHFPDHELIISTYVDDIMLYGDKLEISRMKNILSAEFEVRDLGVAKHVQSIRITREYETLVLDQKAYAKEILKEFQMENCKPVQTPLTVNIKLQNATDEDRLNEEEASRYRTAVGSLLYLATGTRPDLAYPATYSLRQKN